LQSFSFKSRIVCNFGFRYDEFCLEFGGNDAY